MPKGRAKGGDKGGGKKKQWRPKVHPKEVDKGDTGGGDEQATREVEATPAELQMISAGHYSFGDFADSLPVKFVDATAEATQVVCHVFV